MAKKLIKRDFVYISLDLLEPNEGQLEGLPANPRDIDEKKFERLKKNLSKHPNLLEVNMLIVYPLENGHYIIIGGNMRYRALRELGRTEAPCAIVPKQTSTDELKDYAVITNISYGKWNWDMLANEWDDIDFDSLGLDSIDKEWGNLPYEEADHADPVLDKPKTIQIEIPKEMEEKIGDIKAALNVTLEEWGLSVK